jgi:hypothetical protein
MSSRNKVGHAAWLLIPAAAIATGLSILKYGRHTYRKTTSTPLDAPPEVPPRPAASNPAHSKERRRPSVQERNTIIIFDIALQSVVWAQLFSWDRSFYTGVTAIVVPTIIVLAQIFILINIREGLGIFGGAIILEGAFSVLIAAFAGLYWGYGTTSNFNIQLSHLDAIYFSIGTLTTAGTGNLVATSEIARSVQTVQMILDLLLIVFAVTIFLSSISPHLRKVLGVPPVPEKTIKQRND